MALVTLEGDRMEVRNAEYQDFSKEPSWRLPPHEMAQSRLPVCRQSTSGLRPLPSNGRQSVLCPSIMSEIWAALKWSEGSQSIEMYTDTGLDGRLVTRIYTLGSPSIEVLRRQLQEHTSANRPQQCSEQVSAETIKALQWDPMAAGWVGSSVAQK